MMDVNQTPPDRMTAERRLQEVGQLLARGIVRLRMPPQNIAPESEFELDILAGRSVHVVSKLHNRKETV